MATTGIPTNNLTTPTKMRWDNQAIVNCEALNYGGTGAGYTDWRLPNLKELVSIANYGVATAPAIDTTKFPNTQSYYYWSSSTYASGPTGAWYVYFYDGDTGSGLSKTSAYCVRCVRGQ
jgi:hypothetical protein